MIDSIQPYQLKVFSDLIFGKGKRQIIENFSNFLGQSKVPIVDWVNEELLGKNRVSFDTQLSPAMLKIRNVSLEDAGLYR